MKSSTFLTRPFETLPPDDYTNVNETTAAYDHCLWLEKIESWSLVINELQTTVSEGYSLPTTTAATV